jgi:hypothetical protein
VFSLLPREVFIMNATRYVLAAACAVGITVHVTSAHAATIVTHSAVPGYTVTTVHTSGPYWGIQPVPCCYTRVVTTSAVPKAAVSTVVTLPPVRVVYVVPPAVVYATPRITHAPSAYYYVP